MNTVRTETAIMQASIDRIFESPDINKAARNTQLMQAILTINDNLELISEITG